MKNYLEWKKDNEHGSLLEYKAVTSEGIHHNTEMYLFQYVHETRSGDVRIVTYIFETYNEMKHCIEDISKHETFRAVFTAQKIMFLDDYREFYQTI